MKTKILLFTFLSVFALNVYAQCQQKSFTPAQLTNATKYSLKITSAGIRPGQQPAIGKTLAPNATMELELCLDEKNAIAGQLQFMANNQGVLLRFKGDTTNGIEITPRNENFSKLRICPSSSSSWSPGGNVRSYRIFIDDGTAPGC